MLSFGKLLRRFLNPPKTSVRPRRFRPSLSTLERREVPASMYWTGMGGSNAWSNAGNWSSSTVPGSTDDVTVGPGMSGTITTSGTVTVHSIALHSGATLDLGGDFNDNSGGSAENATLKLNGHVFNVNGGIFEAKRFYTFVIDGTTNNSQLYIAADGSFDNKSADTQYKTDNDSVYDLKVDGAFYAERYSTFTFKETGSYFSTRARVRNNGTVYMYYDGSFAATTGQTWSYYILWDNAGRIEVSQPSSPTDHFVASISPCTITNLSSAIIDVKTGWLKVTSWSNGSLGNGAAIDNQTGAVVKVAGEINDTNDDTGLDVQGTAETYGGLYNNGGKLEIEPPVWTTSLHKAKVNGYVRTYNSGWVTFYDCSGSYTDMKVVHGGTGRFAIEDGTLEVYTDYSNHQGNEWECYCNAVIDPDHSTLKGITVGSGTDHFIPLLVVYPKAMSGTFHTWTISQSNHPKQTDTGVQTYIELW